MSGQKVKAKREVVIYFESARPHGVSSIPMIYHGGSGKINGLRTVSTVSAINPPRLLGRIGVDAPEVTARFADPAGNVLGLYQEESGAK